MINNVYTWFITKQILIRIGISYFINHLTAGSSPKWYYKKLIKETNPQTSHPLNSSGLCFFKQSTPPLTLRDI
ncbi:PF07598 family protein [Leptospira santarosai]|nr:PF07598 family protein [Leptospira santarosai]